MYFFVFRWDLDLRVILDYEIWKASHMLFQHIPYVNEGSGNEYHDDVWDDNWHKKFNPEIELSTNETKNNNEIIPTEIDKNCNHEQV